MEHRFLAKMHCIALQYLSLGMYFKVLNSEQWKQRITKNVLLLLLLLLRANCTHANLKIILANWSATQVNQSTLINYFRLCVYSGFHSTYPEKQLD